VSPKTNEHQEIGLKPEWVTLDNKLLKENTWININLKLIP